MTDWKFTYQKMLGYLKGVFSNKDQYELERKVMQDPFDDEAFDGLTELDAEVFEKDMTFLDEKLTKRVAKKQKQFIFGERYKVAATLLAIFGLGIVWYQLTKIKTPEYEFVVSPEFEKEEDTEVVDVYEAEEVVEDQVFENAKNKEKINFSKVEESVIEEEISFSDVEDVGIESDEISKPVLEKPKISTVPKKIKEAFDKDVAVQKQQGSVVFDETEAEIIEKELNEAEEVEKALEPKESILVASKNEITTLWKGRVMDENGTPLSGVSIIIEGTEDGTITDFDGFYEIEAPKDVKLEVIYLGYETEIFDFENAENLVLKEDKSALDQIVVVGYGTTKKVPASILKNADLAVAEASQVSSVNKALSKRTAGVKVTSNQKRKEVAADQEFSTVQHSYSKASPPQGSENGFKNWVIAQLEPSKFDSNETYTFTAEFVVDITGQISECNISSKAKQSIKKQLKKAILNSDKWQPAYDNKSPIDEKVTMQFSILAE